MRLTNRVIVYVGWLAALCAGLTFMFFISEAFRLLRKFTGHDPSLIAFAAEVRSMIVIVGVAALVAMAIFLLSAYLVLSKSLSQLRKALEFSIRLSAGDVQQSLKAESKDELGDLIRALNHMRDRLQYSIVKLRNSYQREKTAREEAENANRLKSEFMHNMSHELRIPLTPIMGFANIILGQVAKGKYDQELETKVRSVRDSADNMLGIIGNLGELSRLERKEIELNITEFESSGLLKELLNLHHFSAENKSIALKHVYSADFPPRLLLDREVLFHVLSNLVAHAISASPNFSEVVVGCETSRKQVVFSVRDNIPGPQAEVIAQLFRKYAEGKADMTDYLTNARHLGLVSAITNAEMLRGQLSADAVPGGGCLFRLSLLKVESVPITGTETSAVHIASNWKSLQELDRPSQGKRPAPRANKKGQDHCIRILIAEDSESNLMLVEQILEDAHIGHESVSDGESCLRAMHAGAFDLLLLDIQMPIMDGYAVVKELRAEPRFKDFPIVIMSAFGDSDDRERLLKAGVNECLIKPVQIQELLQIISSLV